MSLYVDIYKNFGSFCLSSSFETDDMITGLLGSSGCGKSMTLKCIAGIVTPDKGKIVLNGRVLFDSEKKINLPPQRRNVGYLFQNYALFPNMDVRKNIISGLCSVKDKKEREKRFLSVMELLQLQDLGDRKPYQLSGGQAQRVALARMLVSDPELLLMDEPFSALDTHLRDTLQPVMKNILARVGKQVIIVTHSQSEAYRLASKICVMDSGKIIRKGSTHDVFSSPENIAAARLTGYKNIISAEKISENELIIPQWDIILKMKRNIPDNVSAIALSQEAFFPGQDFQVVLDMAIDDVDGRIYLFRFMNMSKNESSIWWKTQELESFPSHISIKEDEIVFLCR